MGSFSRSGQAYTSISRLLGVSKSLQTIEKKNSRKVKEWRNKYM